VANPTWTPRKKMPKKKKKKMVAKKNEFCQNMIGLFLSSILHNEHQHSKDKFFF
jgi:hypothetical protein